MQKGVLYNLRARLAPLKLYSLSLQKFITDRYKTVRMLCFPYLLVTCIDVCFGAVFTLSRGAT